MTSSAMENGMTPLGFGHATAQVHGRHAARPKPAANGDPVRAGEGEPGKPSGPVNWHGMLDDEYVQTFDALTDFLTWAVPHWGFTTEQFPYGCWWLHGDIVEEMTSWWGMWQVYVRNPTAHPADPSVFHERTWNLQQRLAHSYQGRCRHEHQPVPRPVVTSPPGHAG
jgi:hypothetical protein